jgi:hypothetical protein
LGAQWSPFINPPRNAEPIDVDVLDSNCAIGGQIEDKSEGEYEATDCSEILLCREAQNSASRPDISDAGNSQRSTFCFVRRETGAGIQTCIATSAPNVEALTAACAADCNEHTDRLRNGEVVTIAVERSLAILMARNLLPKLPSTSNVSSRKVLRERARALLRHYPEPIHLRISSAWIPGSWADLDSR